MPIYAFHGAILGVFLLVVSCVLLYKTVCIITYINEKKIISQERSNYFVATYY